MKHPSKKTILTQPENGLLHLDDKEGILEVRNINVNYDKIQSLFDIYCHFPANMVTAIMGPSGCGKSTLIKVLNRTIELVPGAFIRSGEVLFHGSDLYGKKQNPMLIRKKIGIIHQQPIPFPMSIIDNVTFGAKFHRLYSKKKKHNYAAMFLEKVGLLAEIKDRLNESALKLSGGQQQRLCLARTLANQPEIILMDEPCSALDPAATKLIEQLIQDLSRDYTIIIVTHNMSQAKRISDHSIFMFEGRIIEAGLTRQIFESPKTELAKAFIEGQIG